MNDKVVQAGIRHEVARINAESIALAEELRQIQNFCQHSNVAKINKCDSGGPMTGREGAYWRECNCPDCGKYWTEPQ